jgi:hypothetical protein
MWTRRKFLTRTLGLGATLAGGGLVLRALSDEGPNGRQARGMINPATQQAIDGGLAFLAGPNGQHGDGSFGTNQYRGSVAITSLAALAFMAGGHQPGRGRYGRVVRDAVRFVVDQAQPMHQGECALLHNRGAPLQGPMYNHGFGTLFLAEVHGMVHERDLRRRVRDTLEKAVRLIIRTQNGEGGWRYQPQPMEADISVTICQIMALRAARNAGITVPAQVAEKCTRYVKGCQDLVGSGGFRYMTRIGQPGFARTAAGVVALYSAGIYQDPSVKKGLDYLLKRCKPGSDQMTPVERQDMSMHYYYGHYYAVQAMWTAGEPYWSQWYPAVRDALLTTHDRDQTEGSWFDRRICKHYCTAMALIVLQVPNNYLPILQR